MSSIERAIVCGEGAIAAAIAQALRTAALEVIVAADAQAVERALEIAQRRGTPIGALVTAPPERSPAATILGTSEAQWDDTLARHLNVVFLACKAMLPHAIARGGGAIVNVAEAAGYGGARRLAGSAAHGAVIALGAALAYDHFHDRVRVNTIVAGEAAALEEIAAVAAFLLSSGAEVMSGSLVDVGSVAFSGV